MKPKSSTSFKPETLSEPFEDDRQALVPDVDGCSIAADLPKSESYNCDEKLHPLNYELRMSRTRRGKQMPSFVSLCLYFSFFGLGVFATLFLTSLQKDFLKQYFSCFQLKVGGDKGVTPQEVLDGYPSDFIVPAPPVSSASCPDTCV